jgi:hypothetical protein
MIFTCLDFHARPRQGGLASKLLREFRRRINHVVDSFSLRIPKKTRTELFHKLNICVSDERCQKVPFFAVEGIGLVEIVDANISSIYKATQMEAVKRVKRFLKRGTRIAAEHDRQFARHLTEWDRLLDTTEQEFDYDLRVSRSHRSRRWRCQAVLRITPAAYHYDVLVKESKSLQTIQRHRIRTTECFLPFFTGIGFSQLRWKREDVVGYGKGKEVFRFQTGLPV